MNQEQICQVTTRDEKWVPTKERVKISTTNVRLETIVPQKEETLQVIINVIKNATCYKAFTIFAEVPEIFMQQFWYTIKKVSGINSYEFLLANKKCLVDAEVFQKILDIYPRVQGVDIAEVPDNTTLTFLLDLGYKDTPEAAVDVSKESDSAPARKKTTSRRVIKKKVIISTNDNIIPDPYVTLEIRPSEQLAADTMKALKESKKTSRRQPGTKGSSKGTGVSLGVPDESTVVPATLSEGTGTKLGVLDEEKVTSKDNVILEWRSEQESEYTKEEDDDETIEWNMYKAMMKKWMDEMYTVMKICDQGDAVKTEEVRMNSKKANIFNKLQLSVPEPSKIQTPTIDLEPKSEKSASEIHKIKKEQAEKQKILKYIILSTDKAALKEYD
ncbi:hypothetical protein Tco_0503857 [Tanacetum coccineum]